MENNLNNEIVILKERILYLEKLNVELAEQNKELREENDRNIELLSFLPQDAKKQIKLKGKDSS